MPYNIDFSDYNVFLGEQKWIEKAIKVDDLLRNNEFFVPGYILAGKDLNEPYDDPMLRQVLNAMGRYLRSVGGDLECNYDHNQKYTDKKYRYGQYRYREAYYGQTDLNRNPFFKHRLVKRKLDEKEAIKRLSEALAFMPEPWIDSFLKETEVLVLNERMGSTGGNIIAPETNLLLTGTEHLAELYQAVAERKVLFIGYNAGYKEELDFIFHPHYLKEYNGRWYVCGMKEIGEGQCPQFSLLALDRITYIDEPVEELSYTDGHGKNYDKYFSDIIGVTHSDEWGNIETVVLRIRNHKVFNLLKTKKLHASQTENEEDGYIELKVRPNIELITKILSFGADIEVLEPLSLRDKVANIVKVTHQIYWG